jgi:hypothetical protein
MAFYDGLINVVNQLANRRNPAFNNRFTTQQLGEEQMRAIYRSGLGSKIVRIKAGYALKDTLQFVNNSDEAFYKSALSQSVKQAAKFMIGFGRGIILIHKRGDDLSKPLGVIGDISDYKLDVFSGDMVTAMDVSLDLSNPRYMKPIHYNVRGYPIHHTRVIDFTYIKPPELDAPMYRYGGISEFEMIYGQMVNDAIVERASAAILERSSNWVYKVEGFKQAMQVKKDQHIVENFSRLEDLRSIHGATIIDSTDSVESLNQSLSNLAEIDQITLRRLAMVTGIPLTVLIGENVKGLNSSGDNETKIFQDTIETLQEEYLLDPINQLLHKMGMASATFKENQGETPGQKVAYEKTVVDIAKVLFDMGRDPAKYLQEKGVEQKDDWESMWGKPEESDAPEVDPAVSMMAELLNPKVDPAP